MCEIFSLWIKYKRKVISSSKNVKAIANNDVLYPHSATIHSKNEETRKDWRQNYTVERDEGKRRENILQAIGCNGEKEKGNL